jgi:hypothetical protein
MDLIILDNIKWKPDVGRLLKKFHIQEGTQDAIRIQDLASQVQEIGKPKVLYKTSYVESKSDDFVVVDGVKLTSRILRINFDKAYRVFPYIATCGTELEHWSQNIDDILESYWVDGIKEMALGEAMKAFNTHLKENFHPGSLSSMNPGSLEDWPISQQTALFRILGNPKDSIGVELTDSYLMVPMKSVSGIRFPTEVSFENCQLCTRERCPGRRAPYDGGLLKSYKTNTCMGQK